MTTLMLSHLRPYQVKEVVAGWEEEEDWGATCSGFIVELVDGEYAYIHSERVPKLRRTVSSTQFFDHFPEWLIFQRARKWSRDKKVLNANLPFAKQAAKYQTEEGSSDRASGGEACSRPVLRIQTA